MMTSAVDAAAGFAEDPLMVLAFDHRSVLHQLYDPLVPGGLTAALAREMKEIVVDALLASVDQITALGGRCSLLMDETYGGEAIRRAQARGVIIAMPLEVSGAERFTLEWGADYLDHLDAFKVDYAKVLVFLNPDLSDAAYQGQIDDVVGALGAADRRGYATMLEVVISPTAEQLQAVDGDALRFDEELRPSLVVRMIGDVYATGLRPTLWKLEGLETEGSYELVAAAVASHDPGAGCLVLGRGENDERVNRWLRLAGSCDRFVGFAVGRSIWRSAMAQWLEDGDRAAVVDDVRRRYVDFASVYLSRQPTAAS